MLQTNIVVSEFGIPTLRVNMNDKETVELDLSGFYRNHDNLVPMYGHINRYLSELPKELQDSLYKVFYDTHRYAQTKTFGDMEAVMFLSEKLDQASSILDLNRWREWFRNNSEGIHIPDTVHDVFEHDPDMGITREKTYVTGEYIDLIGFILFIRAMSPIYIEYLSYAKETSRHPYYLLFRLFMGGVLDNPNTELGKLRSYVEANYEGLIGIGGKNEHLIITNGLSDDDIIDYLIAEVIFNKLLAIEYFSVKCNAVSYIFQTIRYKGSFRGSSAANLRASSSKRGGDRDDYSYFEDYRKTTSIPIGTVVEIQHALGNVDKLLTDLGYQTFDYKLYEQELKLVGEMSEHPPSNVQIYLLGWFLHKVINPRALFHLESRKIAELLILAKIALIHTNQAFIGIFLTSRRGDDDQFLNLIIRNTLNKNLLDNLRGKFKYVMGEERGSVIERTINEIAKEMVNTIWRPIGTLGNVKGVVTKEGYIDMATNVNDIVTSYIAYVLGDDKASPVEAN